MKVAVMQPYFFPYLGYYQLVALVDRFVFLDNVNFIKKGWINRNNILVNGNPFLFSIPLHKASQNKLINNTELAVDDKWRTNFFKTIEMAYSTAPQYHSVVALLHDAMDPDASRISDWASRSILGVMNYLGIKKEFKYASQAEIGTAKSEEQIIRLCHYFNATDYINLPGGKMLYNLENFKKAGLNLHFIQNIPVSYNQGLQNFIPNLSMIDVLMWNTPDQVMHLLSQYTLE